ncbi:MAG: helix-turn-helix domain-containing protein [Pseudomonadota bacterium]
MNKFAAIFSPDMRPAARELLAAAGPVEPHPSPELAPGPSLASLSARKTRADYFQTRRTPALVNQARSLYRRGERYATIARALGVNPDTVRRWLDPDYDQMRRSRAAQRSENDELAEEEALLPTLPFVPGITISGRYRMKRP